MGNLASVKKGLDKVGANASLTSDPNAVASAERLVFPGQGAFSILKTLRERGLTEALLQFFQTGRPYLGICLGLQVLFERGDECPEEPGLGVVAGEVKRLPANSGKIPHIGWNDVSVEKADPLLQGISSGTDFYFAHSYAVVPKDKQVVSLRGQYGEPFVAAIRKDNLYACQFHPEKSQRAGLKLLENFVRS
jgi:glutamine amidotransferase